MLKKSSKKVTKQFSRRKKRNLVLDFFFLQIYNAYREEVIDANNSIAHARGMSHAHINFTVCLYVVSMFI